MKHTLLKLSAVASAVMLISACSPMVVGGSEVDYKSAHAGNPLEIPPDLTKISGNTRFTVPGGHSVSANRFAATQTATPGSPVTHVASNSQGDVRLAQEHGQRWLVVSRPPEKVWPLVKTFWEDAGFVLASEDPRTGIMETDWAENRAKLPMDIIRSTLGKAFDSLYSTGELDRFRTRIERNAQGQTTIAITHRGMKEVLTGRDKVTSTWEARSSEPELENEMLRRLMVALGLPQEQAQAALPKNTTPSDKPSPSADTAFIVNNGELLLRSRPLDAAWRLVGTALDRAGFTIQQRHTGNHSYTVRYVPQDHTDGKKPGLFSRLFGDKDVKPVTYRIQLASTSAGSVVRALAEDGSDIPEAERTRILRIISHHLQVMH